MYRGREASSSSSSTSKMPSWLESQYSLKRRLIEEDDFEWKLPTSSSSIKDGHKVLLKYVGGVDVSFLKEDPSVACGSLVVLDLQTLQLVYQDYSLVRLRVPYIAGFLAFREVPILLPLIEKMKNSQNPYYPQVIMVDGNGKLHPRGFGLACHLGVMANIPTIGVGKNLHYVDGLNEEEVGELLRARGRSGEDFAKLIGNSGCTWGAAMRATRGSYDPIYISIGHRISLDTAINLAKMTRKYHLPEPVRQADLRSREYIRNHKSTLLSLADGSWKTTTAIHLFNDMVSSAVLRGFPMYLNGLEGFCRWHLTDLHTTDECEIFRSFLIKKVYYENYVLTEEQLFAMRLEDFLISNGKRLLRFLRD
ncbi:endonuclease V isoform X1 [Ricinus communis]|uniref:endonuclease V isoform X1 n=1 Tax=Ricinus communis TaxID=3988 RepID=UPI000772337F|nr:endonuclease V isoform X1 [Ricinus communis]|eukprot:XP_015576478.1 endonuclease V isoform X1 [Ricinus communis]